MIASITHDNYKEFLIKYYPVIERSKTAVPENHMQVTLFDQLNGNTNWQEAMDCKLAMTNTKFTFLATADVERKAQYKTVSRNSLFCLLGVRAQNFEYNNIVVALGLEGIEMLDDFS